MHMYVHLCMLYVNKLFSLESLSIPLISMEFYFQHFLASAVAINTTVVYVVSVIIFSFWKWKNASIGCDLSVYSGI